MPIPLSDAVKQAAVAAQAIFCASEFAYGNGATMVVP